MIKAIETKYKGYRFRSRLEARWAVFFDTLGLPWEYEPEGFQLPSGAYYLPDFKVTYPGRWASEIHSRWFEVKGDLLQVTQGEWAKLIEFSSEMGLIVLDGAPSPKMYREPAELLKHLRADGSIGHWEGMESATVVRPFELVSDAMDEDRSGSALWCGKGRLWWDECSNFFDWDYDGGGDLTDIAAACVAARAARFEHGERARMAAV